VGILEELSARQTNRDRPFLIGAGASLTFAQVEEAARRNDARVSDVEAGDVVAIVGDFDADSIALAMRLLDAGAILMPLTSGTAPDHEYFFASGGAKWVIRGAEVERRLLAGDVPVNPLISELRHRNHPGIIFFSSGTTGRPKAILHDFRNFLARYAVPRPPLVTLNFLLFDHAGGINTLLYTLFNDGVVVVPSERTPEAIAADIERYSVELLPATPTFLRMMLLAGLFEERRFPSLRVITYGTERMDQGTLEMLCGKLPSVDFRQTYGLSELGVFQVKSQARDSLWMRIGGDGIETRITDGVLHIRSANRMLGYLNAPSPFVDGWYDTGDIVEEHDGFIKVVGRATEVINVGGLKILPGEVERVALMYPGVLRAKAQGVSNPITGQHIELTVEPEGGVSLDRRALMAHFRGHLVKQLCPSRIVIGPVAVSHRFKQR
jgi:long-chain acyl-CoA synthetase